MEKAINKIQEAIEAMDEIPYSDDYDRDTEIQEIYGQLDKCKRKLQSIQMAESESK